MTKNNKGRNRWHGATPSTSDSGKHTPAICRIKAVIVRLALGGLIPAGFATCLIQRGE